MYIMFPSSNASNLIWSRFWYMKKNKNNDALYYAKFLYEPLFLVILLNLLCTLL